MKTKDVYAFPLYQRIGQAAYSIIASRYWIGIVLLAAIILYAPFLFSGFFQDDYGFRLQFSPEILRKGGVPPEVMVNDPWNLYGFSWNSTARFHIQQEKGFAPWWTDKQIQTNFFRPLSSLTLALDFTLWPGQPLLMHLHSLLWFCLLIILAYRLYRAIFGSAYNSPAKAAAAAGVSILLLAADDVFAGPAGWISNRHAVVAMVFCVLCVWLYHQGAAKQKWQVLAGSCGAYGLALLASEMGLVTFAYLFAYFLVLDRDTWLNRAKRLAPFLVITIAWRLAYTASGYGARGTLLYIDPVINPLGFISQMLTRLPVLLYSAVGLPVVDMILAFSPHAAGVLAVLCFVLLVPLVAIVYPVLQTRRMAAFWAIGLLAAVIPLVSGIPQNRNLGPVSLGVMGLAGPLFVDVAASLKTAPLRSFQRILLKITTPILLILYLVVSPALVISNPGSTRVMAEEQARAASFPGTPGLAEQHLFVINPPGAMSFMAGLFQRLFSSQPFPASINYLTSGFAPVHIARVDAQTILVTPEGGYTPLPGPVVNPNTGAVAEIDLQNVYRAMDGFQYNPQHPMRVGQAVVLSEATVKVTKMTGDGRIAQASFTFNHPLEDQRYVWLEWDAGALSYKSAEMPPVGQERVYPDASLDQAFRQRR